MLYDASIDISTVTDTSKIGIGALYQYGNLIIPDQIKLINSDFAYMRFTSVTIGMNAEFKANKRIFTSCTIPSLKLTSSKKLAVFSDTFNFYSNNQKPTQISVPSNLVSEYQADTIWTSICSNIVAIE